MTMSLIKPPFYYLGFNRLPGQLFAIWWSFVLTGFSLLRLLFNLLTKGRQHFYIVDREVHKPELAKDSRLGKHRIVQLKKQNIRLHCVESGDVNKPLMLFVHGFPECWYSWKYQIQEFSADYHVVAVNMRGYGDSDKPNTVRAYATDMLVADLAELIGEYTSDKCILVAHDWGGVVAWLLAAQHPNLVDRFIVLNAPHPAVWTATISTNWGQFFRSWYMFFFNMPYVPEISIMSGDFSIFDRLFEKYLKKDEIDIYKYYFGRCYGVTGPLNYYRARLRGYGQKNKQKQNRVSPKTLIIWGDRDLALVSSLAEDSGTMCDAGQVRLVEGASHWVQMDQPKVVNTYMREFLEK